MQMKWLPDMDLNHDKQIQSLLCYRYTIGQTGVSKVKVRPLESRLVEQDRTGRGEEKRVEQEITLCACPLPGRP
jgi:hypothetical protein